MMYCPRPQARAPLLTSTLSLFPWDPALFTVRCALYDL